VSPAVATVNPGMKIEIQVESIAAFNAQIIQMSFIVLMGGQQFGDAIQELAVQAEQLADSLPLMALTQKALVASMTQFGEDLAKKQGQEAPKQLGRATAQLVSEQALETSYGLIRKNQKL